MDVFSFTLDPMSSELAAFISPLNRLSPRVPPNPGLFSADVGVCPPREKFPKAPIGGKPADGGAPDHGEDGPFAPALTGFVVVLLREPKGEAKESLSLSSRLEPKVSLKSVLRLRSEGGGDDMFDSSLEYLLLAIGDVRGLLDCRRSPPDSRRRVPGRVDGELIVAFCVIEVLRFKVELFGVPSLFVFWVGGLSGELTDVANACRTVSRFSSSKDNIRQLLPLFLPRSCRPKPLVEHSHFDPSIGLVLTIPCDHRSCPSPRYWYR